MRSRASAPAPFPREAAVYVLDGLAPGAGARLVAANLRPALGSLDEIAEWGRIGRACGRKLAAALHFDTGMNRFGLAPRDAAQAAAQAGEIDTALVMSHFVSSQLPDSPRNAAQIAAFAAPRAHFHSVPGSLCNSSGIFLPARPHLDLTRPGYALYGGNPTPGAANPMRPVVAVGGAHRGDARNRGWRKRRL